MKTNCSRTKTTLALGLAALLSFGPAMADKPSWAGADKDRGHEEKGARHDTDGKGSRDDRERDHGRNHFEDRHRVVVRDYYDHQHSAGRCPPGLAKKHNGCMPPGQARKWNMGQPLARNVTYYKVPQPLLTKIGQPPAGYRYARVDSDILLMDTRTRTVVDAIQNLGRG